MTAKIRDFRTIWRGDPVLIEASVEKGRVRIYSLRRLGKTVEVRHEGMPYLDAEPAKTYLDAAGAVLRSPADYATALSALTPDEREELYQLVLEAARR